MATSTQPVVRLLQRVATSKRVQIGTSLILAFFVTLNVAILGLYHDRTYPNTTIGRQHLGSVSHNDLSSKLQKMPLLPEQVTFKQGRTSSQATVAGLGISINYDQLRDRSLSQRSWLPVANLWQSHSVALTIQQDAPTLASGIADALGNFQKQPSDARINRRDDSFAITPESAGQTVDIAATKQRLVAALSKGDAQVTVATKVIKASVSGSSLQSELQSLNKQTKVSVTLRYNEQSKRLTASEIASLYNQDTSHMTISDAAVLTTINNTGAAWGIVVDNQAAAQQAIKAGIQDQKDVLVTLVAAPKALKTIRYCTAVRGVSQSELPALEAKLQSTYTDGRGWSINGLVHFEKSDAGCELKVWLAAADQMPSFGAICDSTWSCTVHPNVIINYDRWRYASEAWNAQRGNLEDYRAMVINHESGHWFGFNHAFCAGPGQPAPVMQQQSIDLQGCSFNPWPTAGEQASLKRQLSL